MLMSYNDWIVIITTFHALPPLIYLISLHNTQQFVTIHLHVVRLQGILQNK